MKKQMSEQELKEKTRGECLKALAKLEKKARDNFKTNFLLKAMCLDDEHAGLVDKLIDSCLEVQASKRAGERGYPKNEVTEPG